MESIKQAHPYLKYFMVLHYMFALVCSFCLFVYKLDLFFYLLIYSLIVLGIQYIIKQYRLKQTLNYLISHVDAIVDQKNFDVIDGEGELSLLSHKIFLLNKRYHALIEASLKEQVQLKDSIENISHQLKTPITSMRINEELLLDILQEPKQHRLVKQIYLQTLKINHLVNDLLTLALLESQTVTMKFEHYPINVIIEDVEEDLEYIIHERDMHIVLHNTHEDILCDRKWFGEALKNIIKNSVEKNQHSSIDITVKVHEALMTLIIQDHGEGFQEEDIPHLFERFYRGQNNDYQGIGIGLALSKEIIEQHHGFIQVKNQEGALIEITIPRLLVKKKL